MNESVVKRPRLEEEEEPRIRKRVVFQEDLNSKRKTQVVEEEEDEGDEEAEVVAMRSRKVNKEDSEGSDEEDEHPASSDWKTSEERYRHDDLQRLDEENLEAFNMDEENDLGSFDRQGGFTWKRRDKVDGDEEDEVWLNQVGDQLATQRKRNKEEESEEEQEEEKEEVLLWRIICHLQDAMENALGALKRIPSHSKSFVELTESCDALLRRGFVDVYSVSRDRLLSKLTPLLWEYKVGNEDGENSVVFGPFSGVDMQNWREEQGVFKSDSVDKCFVRLHQKTNRGEWIPAERVETFLLKDRLV